MLYLADMADGLYLIHEDITPGTEEMAKGNSVADIMMSSPQYGLMKLSVKINAIDNVAITVYDASGRLVKSMQKGNLAPGVHKFTWNPDAAGVYFVRVQTDIASVARKVVFLR
jgi:flagellar hook assembly protein FlgD